MKHLPPTGHTPRGRSQHSQNASKHDTRPVLQSSATTTTARSLVARSLKGWSTKTGHGDLPVRFYSGLQLRHADLLCPAVCVVDGTRTIKEGSPLV